MVRAIAPTLYTHSGEESAPSVALGGGGGKIELRSIGQTQGCPYLGEASGAGGCRPSTMAMMRLVRNDGVFVRGGETGAAAPGGSSSLRLPRDDKGVVEQPGRQFVLVIELRSIGPTLLRKYGPYTRG